MYLLSYSRCLIYADNISGKLTELDILCYIEYVIESDINSASADTNKRPTMRLS